MESLGEWIAQARTRAGLSTRELARLAGVAYPTVSRIENGRSVPRWDTVAKLVRPLGADLEMSVLKPRPVPRLADLVDACNRTGGGPDWTRLRGFADQLRRHPELAGAAIGVAPEPASSPLLDNLLAAMAEKVADDAGLRRPRWTRDVPPLPEAWEAPGTPRMRHENTSNAAPQFAARNIMLPASTIWRERPVPA